MAVFNELLLLQMLMLGLIGTTAALTTILMFWYVAGLYLLLLGLFLFCHDGDILVGFLWVIDLGVGLIFFIFILHFTNFLYQKVLNGPPARLLLAGAMAVGLCLLLIATALNAQLVVVPRRVSAGWFMTLSWYDYYDFFLALGITELNWLHYMYFVSSSVEFILINFFILYGIVVAIAAFFLFKYLLWVPTLRSLAAQTRVLRHAATYFIRTQDFLVQQNTLAGLRIWTKARTVRSD